jgi:predicted heme/steroid binding protein
MYSRNYVATGLEVNGNNVNAYGLFVEHTLGDLVSWNGEDGEVYFYQSELPYDVTQDNYANKGYHSYHVADKVQRHTSHGAGVYSFFRDNDVHMDTGIKAPSGSGIKFNNAFNKMLSGNGGIDHVLNTQGGSAYNSGMSYLCGYHSEY